VAARNEGFRADRISDLLAVAGFPKKIVLGVEASTSPA
jgi:hypothetical protein